MCVKIHKKKVWKHVYQTEKVISFGRGWGGRDKIWGQDFKRNFDLYCVHFFNINVFVCYLYN